MSDTPKPTVDRPVEEIIRSMGRLVADGAVKGQFARDLEKLCAFAKTHPKLQT